MALASCLVYRHDICVYFLIKLSIRKQKSIFLNCQDETVDEVEKHGKQEYRSTKSEYCTSDTTGTSVVQLLILGQRRSKALPIISCFHQSSNLCVSSLTFPRTTELSLCLSKRCLSLLSDGSEQDSVCVQRETISSLYVCVCLRAWIGGCVYQREKSRRSRPSLYKLINRPFVRAETGPNKI